MFGRDVVGYLRSLPRTATVVLALGVLSRLVAWQVYAPSWKTHATLYPMHVDVLAYAGDFVSYVPGRLPFFNILSYYAYRVTAPVLGVRALAVFAVLVGVVSLPFFYEAVRRVFDERTATFALLLYALYPKLVVMTAWGMSEAGTAAFIGITLYAAVRATETERPAWYLAAGVFAMLSFLMYLSTVVFAVLLSVALYARQVAGSDRAGPTWWVPDVRSWAYNAAPGVAGLLYLRYGPLLDDIPGLHLPGDLFLREYSTVESAVRYVAYTLFDFWWHSRGFDRADGIFQILGNLESLFGPLFPVYLGGWALVVLTATALIAVGVWRLARKPGTFPRFVVVWTGAYVAIKLVENVGWQGTFQTRHLIGVFPALAVAFGVGAAAVLARVGGTDLSASLPVEPRTVASVLLTVGLVVLVVNATVNGALRADGRVQTAAAEALEDEVQDGDLVGVATYTTYADTMAYTGGRVVPGVLHRPGRSLGFYEEPGPLGGWIATAPANVTDTDVTVFFAQSTCTDFRPQTREYLDAARDAGTVVYNRTFEGYGRCEPTAVAVRLRSADRSG